MKSADLRMRSVTSYGACPDRGGSFPADLKKDEDIDIFERAEEEIEADPLCKPRPNKRPRIQSSVRDCYFTCSWGRRLLLPGQTHRVPPPPFALSRSVRNLLLPVGSAPPPQRQREGLRFPVPLSLRGRLSLIPIGIGS
ncbi:hypothetical protein MLD38_030248 [Melastoma candidum]|uniref:Uncharacterized protein n=1 Tax=Melastoma candidum TaxID=119954 RepID=A0ACB9MKN7_9MYRT|nr:hypothetical protein MLD38_030248 [Melastoma candidum]